MKIKILKSGRYNDANNKAQNVQAGQEFETSGTYGTLLVADGLALFTGDGESKTIKIPKSRVVSTLDEGLDEKPKTKKQPSKSAKKNEFMP